MTKIQPSQRLTKNNYCTDCIIKCNINKIIKAILVLPKIGVWHQKIDSHSKDWTMAGPSENRRPITINKGLRKSEMSSFSKNYRICNIFEEQKQIKKSRKGNVNSHFSVCHYLFNWQKRPNQGTKNDLQWGVWYQIK